MPESSGRVLTPPTRSTLVCPSCKERMLYVPGGVTYRCDECKQVWECVWEAETTPARVSSRSGCTEDCDHPWPACADCERMREF
jgi:hypothetical protein